MERAAGIEPACLTWKDSALPLSYARLLLQCDAKIRFWASFFSNCDFCHKLFILSELWKIHVNCDKNSSYCNTAFCGTSL